MKIMLGIGNISLMPPHTYEILQKDLKYTKQILLSLVWSCADSWISLILRPAIITKIYFQQNSYILLSVSLRIKKTSHGYGQNLNRFKKDFNHHISDQSESRSTLSWRIAKMTQVVSH